MFYSSYNSLLLIIPWLCINSRSRISWITHFTALFFFCFKLGQFQVENISNAICWAYTKRSAFCCRAPLPLLLLCLLLCSSLRQTGSMKGQAEKACVWRVHPTAWIFLFEDFLFSLLAVAIHTKRPLQESKLQHSPFFKIVPLSLTETTLNFILI